MRKTTLARGILLACAAGLAGCANGDYSKERQTREGVTINGSHFASAEENDQNAFGRETDGLSSNPKTQPSADDLGTALNGYDEVVITAEPAHIEAFVNDAVDIKFKVSGRETQRNANADTKSELKPILKNVQLAVILEAQSGTDGAIEFFSGQSVKSSSPTKIVLTTDSSGEAVVRFYTGTAYSKKNPTYYINAWQANDAFAEVVAYVNKVPQIGDSDNYKPGSKDRANDLTAPDAMKDVTDWTIGNAIIRNDDPLNQELFVNGTKRLRVTLLKASDSATADSGTAISASEPICWKLVTHQDNNGAFVSQVYLPDGDDYGNASNEGCSKTDDKGAFWVEINTGFYYDERYFLNFFHQNATPLSYRIDTFIAPETLGEQGNDAEYKQDVSVTEEDYIKGKIDENTTETLIKEIFGDKDCQEPRRSILEQCYESGCEFNCMNGEGSATCKGEFKCTMERNSDGSWSIIGKDGNPVKGDMDGDCNCYDKCYTPDKNCALPNGVTCVENECNNSGKSCLDAINIILDKDENGKITYNGVDTDGDGKPDVAPDVCKAEDPAPSGCDAKYRFVWGTDGSSFYNKKLSTPIGKELKVFVKAYEPYASAQNIEALDKVQATIKRGSFASNDAMLRLANGADDHENITFDIKAIVDNCNNSGQFVFWSGKAFGALYYVQLLHDNVKPSMIPILTTNAVNMPSGEGDSPDEKELEPGGAAVTPPASMGDADLNLGKCYLFIDPNEIETVKKAALDLKGSASTLTELIKGATGDKIMTDLQTPIARTLILSTALVCDKHDDKNPVVVKNVKTHWKLTRGKSTYNNGTLLSSVNATGSDGVASSQFYAGTGYGATYYVSVFHPNAVTSDCTAKTVAEYAKCDKRPAIFEVKVNNSKGVVPGVGENDDPILPGDTTGTDKYGNKGICCNIGGIDCEETCKEPTSSESSAIMCPNIDKRTYVYCDESKGTETHGEKPEKNKGLPEVACDMSKSGCKEGGTGECTYYDNTAIAEGDGCVALYVDKISPVNAALGRTESIPVKMGVYYAGSGYEKVSEKVYATLNKPDGGDGSFFSETQKTSLKSGKATFYFQTGSMTTSYKLTFSHPNFADNKGSMIPVSIMVNTMDKSLIEEKTTSENILNLNAIGAADGDTVKFYVLSSAYNNCSNAFALNEQDKVQAACEAAQGPSDWTDAKKNTSGVTKKDICGQSPTTGTAGIELRVPNYKANFVAYAVSYDSKGSPTKWGCEENLDFVEARCSSYEQKTVTKNGKETTESVCSELTLSKSIALSDIPYVLGDSYGVKSIIDIGPLIEIPTSSGCNDKSIGCALRKVKDLYNKYIGQDPGQKVIDALEKFVFPYEMLSDELKKEGDKTQIGCMSYSGMGKKFDADACGSTNDIKGVAYKKCCANGNIKEDQCSDPSATNTCPGNVSDHRDATWFYKKSQCVCGKVYYWTGDCDTCNTLGAKLKPLVLKGLKSLVNSAFEKAALEDNLCKVIDSIQYIQLKGNATFNSKGNDKAISTVMMFNGIEIPLAGTSVQLEGARIITGKTPNTVFSADSGSISIPSMSMTLSYGELILSIFGELIPGAYDEETGKLDLANIIKCSKMLNIGSGFKIPVVNISITPEMVDFVCGIALPKADDYATSFAEQKYVNLNIDLTGSAQLSSDKCVTRKGSACVSESLKNGIWSGKGSMSGKKSAITGAWVALRNGSSYEYPELSYGEQSLDEYMAANSICRKVLSADDTVETTNKACLGGSFDNPKARPSGNKCSNDGCKGKKGIVVCNSDGSFNAAYANATAAEIIKAANAACKVIDNNVCKGSDDESCKNNPEIINGGCGLTNQECMKDSTLAVCESDNPSIVVYKDGSGSYKYDAESCSTSDKSLTEAECATKACTGKCSEPGCVMNSEVVGCKDSEEEGAKPQPVAAEQLAVWNFDTSAKLAELQAALNEGKRCDVCPEGVDIRVFFDSDTGTGCTAAQVKLVQGSDGKLGAVGTNATVSECGSESDGIAGKILVKGKAANYKITKITFNVLGAGRRIGYGLEGKNVSTSYNSPENTWDNRTLEIADGQLGYGESFTFYVGPTGNATADMPAMRIDDIIVYGIKNPQATDAASGETSPTPAEEASPTPAE